MVIREVEKGELPDLSRLYAQLIGRESDPARMGAVYDRMAANPDHFLLGCYDGARLCGTLQGTVCLDLTGECRPFLVIENVVVDSADRGTGAGRLLMEEAERRAQARGCAYIMLLSSAFRTRAHRFYEKCGFSGSEAVGFRKQLHPPRCAEKSDPGRP